MQAGARSDTKASPNSGYSVWIAPPKSVMNLPLLRRSLATGIGIVTGNPVLTSVIVVVPQVRLSMTNCHFPAKSRAANGISGLIALASRTSEVITLRCQIKSISTRALSKSVLTSSLMPSVAAMFV